MSKVIGIELTKYYQELYGSKYEAINALRKAMVEFYRVEDVIEKAGITMNAYDDVWGNVREAIESLLPNGFGFFSDNIEDFSTNELFLIEELASKDELESILFSSDLPLAKLVNGTTFYIKGE
jgi:hypothetical protein